MGIADRIFTPVSSSSITVSASGVSFNLAATYKDPIDNAGGANGAAIADGDGKVYGPIYPSADTAANHNAQVLADGLLGYKTDIRQAVIGNGALYGGVPLNLNSQSCRVITGDGTQAKNGQALSDALTEFSSVTPYGSALSASNLAWLLLGPGTYDLTGLAGNVEIPNYVGIIGIAGSQATVIKTDGTHRFTVTQAATMIHYSYLKGLTLLSVAATPTASIVWTFGADGPTYYFYLDHDDLDFPGLSSAQACMGIGSLLGLTNPTFMGKAYNCRTTGMGLYGGHTTAPTSGNLTFNVRFERCRGGDRSFGASSNTTVGTRPGLVSGSNSGIYNCEHFGTANQDVIIDCPVLRCEWVPAIQRIGSSAYIAYNRIGTAASTFSINHNAAVDAKIAFNRMVGGIGSNITNLLDTAVSNGGNLIDAQA